jgi:phospholipase C
MLGHMVDSGRLIRRRTFIGGAAAGLAGTAAGLSGCDGPVEAPARAPGRLDDVEHVVILMQENRSFDHYFGTMRGVRGLTDRAALRLPNGRDVFYQPDPLRPDGGYLLPFHVDTGRVDGQDLGDLDHSWDGTHLAWNGGRNDGWVATKTELTMSYFTRADVPFHRALAEAFTVCDNYFCSVQGPTTPNRLYLWTGTIDPDGEAGGPVIANPGHYRPVYRWTTYPERLQAAGISWQVYANQELEENRDHPLSGDAGNNSLWLFRAYHDSMKAARPRARELARRGGLHPTWLPNSGQGKYVDHALAHFISDCRAGTLPAVSWLVAPDGYSEHPAARPVDGAEYTHAVLRAVWQNPDLRESTVILINFDENDGFFDHVIPPVAPPRTPREYVDGRPIGLGPRVPMTVISPWSRGGWVNSQVFDHTSVIRFLEAWTGVREPNISAWRRAICGDLTTCFDFHRPNMAIPALPDTARLRAEADRTQAKLPPPAPPSSGHQEPPVQEPGTRRARAIPYQPMADLVVAGDHVTVAMANAGTAALQLAVYWHTPSSELASARVDVAAGGTATASVPLQPSGAYVVAVHGPNGFLRRAAGDASTTAIGLEASLHVVRAPRPALSLVLSNHGASPLTARVTGAPGNHATSISLVPSGRRAIALDPLTDARGWYDVTVTLDGAPAYLRAFAGKVEERSS